MNPIHVFRRLCSNAIAGGLLAALLVLPGGAGIAQDKSGYKVGDRLPATGSAKPAAAKPSAFKLITWEELVPKDWDPMKGFKDLNLQNMIDSDPRAMKALDDLRESWNNAPVRPELNKTMIRIPGFVIPLERQNDRMTEFLVVPYFGACIHTPPPPSNQIIHAITDRPVAGFRTMDAAWISGEIETLRSDTGFGAAGYRMRVSVVERYKRP